MQQLPKLYPAASKRVSIGADIFCNTHFRIAIVAYKTNPDVVTLKLSVMKTTMRQKFCLFRNIFWWSQIICLQCTTRYIFSRRWNDSHICATEQKVWYKWKPVNIYPCVWLMHSQIQLLSEHFYSPMVTVHVNPVQLRSFVLNNLIADLSKSLLQNAHLTFNQVRLPKGQSSC